MYKSSLGDSQKSSFWCSDEMESTCGSAHLQIMVGDAHGVKAEVFDFWEEWLL